MSGFRRSLEVLPQVLACAVTFAVVLFAVTNTMGPALAVILASIAAMIAMVAAMKVWQPAEPFRLEGDVAATTQSRTHTTGELVSAWTPYMLLVAFVLAWRYQPIQGLLNSLGTTIPVPLLHDVVTRVPAADRRAVAVRRDVQLQLAVRGRHVVLPRRVRVVPSSSACPPGSSWAS